ncbi:ABC transporter ATP-binding protein [Clostridium magnum]|uniref:Maltose/maltodextrin import ATP-binding protein MalK n=1 Tax=Clostridium magnum DSM 2767 TaxID=1121326 RepID=A0A162QYB6_9CLOT|nr:ABC transporter ATP-binding protein [Clostridium magnum]KZL89145.1 maltose/maltodextrin import ATP-binding protein MalK [Clostridium magnum DSM 2767]SHI03894.1 putative spermidine/putrescine transport system ATP-binding protein [Clostridium magnum DSM 2767]
MSLLSLNNIKVAYDSNVILKDLNLSVEKGELVSLLGPSGCGKTTTLRTIAGFNDIKEGSFIFNGKDYTKVPVHKRNFGFVFQSYALFPHLSVFDNVAFGLKLRKINKDELTKRVNEIIDVVGLKELVNRLPRELSGGQRQRVALARSLVINPDLLLFDEPLSNLDAKLRVNMRVEIRRIQQKLGITSIYVTHDQEECFSISDKVAVMNGGVIEQLDSPQNIYKNPSTEFVARFVGYENFIELDIKGQEADKKLFESKSGNSFEVENDSVEKDIKNYKGAIRPEDIEIIMEGDERKNNILSGIVKISTFLGKEYQYMVETEEGTLLVNHNTNKRYENGEKIKMYFPKERIVLV